VPNGPGYRRARRSKYGAGGNSNEALDALAVEMAKLTGSLDRSWACVLMERPPKPLRLRANRHLITHWSEDIEYDMISYAM
jgi:hypothetical protein